MEPVVNGTKTAGRGRGATMRCPPLVAFGITDRRSAATVPEVFGPRSPCHWSRRAWGEAELAPNEWGLLCASRIPRPVSADLSPGPFVCQGMPSSLCPAAMMASRARRSSS